MVEHWILQRKNRVDRVTHFGNKLLHENLQTQYHTLDKEVFYKGCILCGDDQETQDSRKISKHLKQERMRVMQTSHYLQEWLQPFRMITAVYL